MLSRGRVNGGAVSREVRGWLTVVPPVSNNDEVFQNQNSGADYPEINSEQQDSEDQRNLNAQERMQLQSLKQIADEQRKQIGHLSQSVKLALQTTKTLPKFVDLEFIKKKMASIARNLILGFRQHSSI
ncbi:hypothetical protein KC19_VG155800 [Ceratodon purpureus]|uniref:Uncharacterized protein n=1 Tax=Ceratodon purpureus TaxID=3225 RepID=A0A8T0HR23_CERPU|nr:hypothetical protein KC19_VG155800 [Ceratodon purpureus]